AEVWRNRVAEDDAATVGLGVEQAGCLPGAAREDRSGRVHVCERAAALRGLWVDGELRLTIDRDLIAVRSDAEVGLLHDEDVAVCRAIGDRGGRHKDERRSKSEHEQKQASHVCPTLVRETVIRL